MSKGWKQRAAKERKEFDKEIAPQAEAFAEMMARSIIAVRKTNSEILDSWGSKKRDDD